jgi:hypothetical protein
VSNLPRFTAVLVRTYIDDDECSVAELAAMAEAKRADAKGVPSRWWPPTKTAGHASAT